jgi:hypothetical protein
MADKDVQRLLRELEREGWRIVQGRRYKAFPPNGAPMVTIPGTPRSRRSLVHLKGKLRAGGYEPGWF